MRKKKTMIALIASLAMMLVACGQVTTKITVVNEQGDPVEGAEVKLWYVNYRDEEMRVFETDAEGRIEDTGTPDLRINLSVTKEGYYETSYRKSEGTSISKDQNHDLMVTLRKKINPIPMYAKNVKIQLPKLDENLGFDLIVSDWVQPFGKGLNSDLIFFGQKYFEDNLNYETKITVFFDSEFEGMKEDLEASRNGKYFNSELKTSRIAPSEDYNNKFQFISRKSSGGGYEGSSVERNFVFRTRCILDKSGNLVSAQYGKMKGAIDVSRGSGLKDSKPIVSFTYYFNPNVNDRNLEFDPERNLFKNLTRDEQVTKP